MGRNVIPKLNEWRDGTLFRFRNVGNEEPVTPDSGHMIAYERLVPDGPTDTIATAYADGFQEVMAAMWNNGYMRGLRDGEVRRVNQLRAALELPPVGYRDEKNIPVQR